MMEKIVHFQAQGDIVYVHACLAQDPCRLWSIGALLLVSCGKAPEKPEEKTPANRAKLTPQEFQAINEGEKRCVFVRSNAGFGSGVIVETGFVLVVSHQIEKGSKVFVDDAEAKIAKNALPEGELVLLQVKTKSLPPVTVNENPQKLWKVFYVGNPFNIRKAVFFGTIVAIFDGFVYNDAQALPGASGSGLYTLQGELVGIQVSSRGFAKGGGIGLAGGAPKRH